MLPRVQSTRSAITSAPPRSGGGEGVAVPQRAVAWRLNEQALARVLAQSLFSELGLQRLLLAHAARSRVHGVRDFARSVLTAVREPLQLTCEDGDVCLNARWRVAPRALPWTARAALALLTQRSGAFARVRRSCMCANAFNCSSFAYNTFLQRELHEARAVAAIGAVLAPRPRVQAAVIAACTSLAAVTLSRSSTACVESDLPASPC